MRLRAALAALYCADMTMLLIEDLVPRESTSPQAKRPVILEGPLAGNAAYLAALSAALQPRSLLQSADTLEGTARGAWMLAWWQVPGADAGGAPAPVQGPSREVAGLLRAHRRAFLACVKTT